MSKRMKRIPSMIPGNCQDEVGVFPNKALLKVWDSLSVPKYDKEKFGALVIFGTGTA